MPRLTSNGIELEYAVRGDERAPPLLLVMGLGMPAAMWPDAFLDALVAEGFRVVTFDNRDSGASTRLAGTRIPNLPAAIAKALLRRKVRSPYTLDDMALDTVGLLDGLAIERAHVVGVSMGGMIAQTMAIGRPERVRSLTSIMSTLGKRTVGWQHPKLLPMLIAPRGPGRAAYAETSARMWQVIGSPSYPQPHAEVLRRAEDTWDRGFSANGVMRQMLAILAQPDRTPALRRLSVPTLVVHGLSDRMVHVSGGRATAAAVPGAELLLVDGMGHDLPKPLFTGFAEAIRRTADRAASA